MSSKRSAWSVPDLEEAIGRAVAGTGVIADPGQIRDLIGTITTEAADLCRSISDPRDGEIPASIRHLTNARVIDVEEELATRFAARGQKPGADLDAAEVEQIAGDPTLGKAQVAAVAAMAGTHQVVLVEGAAGSGKTTMLKTAKEARDATQSTASSVHKLLHEHGWRWDADGIWTHLEPGDIDPATGSAYRGPAEEFTIDSTVQLVVDEAGMIDQDTAVALLRLADEHQAQLIMIGDRAQLPAVGRGGVMDIAARNAVTAVDVDEVHRFHDPTYVDVSLKLRSREDPDQVFDELYRRGQIILHDSPEDALSAVAAAAVDSTDTGCSVALTVATNEQATRLNREVRALRVAHSLVDHRTTVLGSDGLDIGRGDVVMTRKNDTELGIANRDTYTVIAVGKDGSLTLTDGGKRRHQVSADYVAANVHLGYASTDYGAQGATVHTAHAIATDSMSAGGAYVALTRGKTANQLHLAAESYSEAKETFVAMMGRESGDRGLAQAREQLARQIQGLDFKPNAATLHAEPARMSGPLVVVSASTHAGHEVGPRDPHAALDGFLRQFRARREALRRLEQQRTSRLPDDPRRPDGPSRPSAPRR